MRRFFCRLPWLLCLWYLYFVIFRVAVVHLLLLIIVLVGMGALGMPVNNVTHAFVVLAIVMALVIYVFRRFISAALAHAAGILIADALRFVFLLPFRLFGVLLRVILRRRG